MAKGTWAFLKCAKCRKSAPIWKFDDVGRNIKAVRWAHEDYSVIMHCNDCGHEWLSTSKKARAMMRSEEKQLASDLTG